MIAADTSTWVGFLAGGAGEDIEMLAKGGIFRIYRRVAEIGVVACCVC